ncbi:MAG: ATP-binding protein [Planctomycetaceae bacterium]
MMIDIATEERYVDPTAELSHVPWELVHRIAVEVPRLESANGSAPLIEDECLRMERFAGDQQDDGTVIRGTRDAGDRVQLGIGTRPMFRLDKRLFDRTVLRLGRGLIGMHQLPVVNAFRSGLAEIQFIDLTPSAMKDYVSSQIHDLGDQGQNLSQIVHRVSEDDQTRQRLLEWISEVSAPRIVDFDFEVTRLGDVLLYLVEEDGRRISARSLSDGTLRFLGYLAAVFSAEEGSVLLFEEIENGLHPTRVHLLVELFEQLAALRNIQIIATTHSSQVLLALSREALESVVLFARNEEHPGTIVRRLGELPHFHETIERTHIDELFTTGWLEFAV